MSYESIKSRLHQLQKQLNNTNYKKIKFSLIGLQQQLASTELEAAQRAELRDAIQAVFENVKVLQQTEREQREKETSENFDFLKQKMVEAIDFTQQNLEHHDLVWQKLIETQRHFKGKRLLIEQREQLYNTLQKLFDILKKRKDEDLLGQEDAERERFEQLEKITRERVENCKSENTEIAWAQLLHTKDQISHAQLLYAHRKLLMDKIQEGFDLLKQRRTENQPDITREAIENAHIIEQKLVIAHDELKNNPDFKTKWDLLLEIQEEFKRRKLEKETRNTLYDQLQALFQQLKAEQYSNQPEFENQANENVNYLRPLIEKAMEEAQITTDLKKTKAFLIKVQGEFKGRKMRSFEREKLFSRLQSAFDLLNSRIEEEHSH
jgi:hypothetical protein